MLKLDGKTALITGASQGIGAGAAEAFAEEGCNLHLTARNEDALSSMASRLRESQRIEVKTHPLDLTAKGAIEELVAAVGDVDILLNNAGVIPGGSPERQIAVTEPVPQPVAVAVPTDEPAEPVEEIGTVETPAETTVPDEVLAGATDDLFDHSEDVEFILDPVALRRGRAIPLPSTPAAGDVQVERAVITF